MERTIDLDIKLLPQLIVFSAIMHGPQSDALFIENRCCMISNERELNAEIEAWANEVEAQNWTMTHICARFVPRSVYAGQ